MSYQEDSTIVKIYQLPQGLAKDLAKQLHERQGSSFFDIVYALAMSALTIAAIVMAFVVANRWKEKEELPACSAMHIIVRTVAFDKDEILQALKAKLEELATREAQREGQRVMNGSPMLMALPGPRLRHRSSMLLMRTLNISLQHALSSDKSTGTGSGLNSARKILVTSRWWALLRRGELCSHVDDRVVAIIDTQYRLSTLPPALLRRNDSKIESR